MSVQTDPAVDPGPVDRAFASRWYDSWIAAWNSHDPEEIRAIITEDFVLETPTTAHTGMTVVGRDQTRDYVAYVVTAYPDLIWERTLPPLYADDVARAGFWWRGTGHFTGVLDPPGVTGTGRAFAFSGLEVFDFRGGQACRLRASYDLLGLMKQLGVGVRAR